MKFLNIISRVSIKHIWKLVLLCLPNLGKLWPTYRATKACMQIANERFGRKHYANGPANAFRHALWNVLIAKNCKGSATTIEGLLQWTKKITDWHEAAFFSKELPMKMDYHNNRVGRELFGSHPDWHLSQFLSKLMELTENAVKIDYKTDLQLLKNQLVYISNDT